MVEAYVWFIRTRIYDGETVGGRGKSYSTVKAFLVEGLVTGERNVSLF